AGADDENVATQRLGGDQGGRLPCCGVIAARQLGSYIARHAIGCRSQAGRLPCWPAAPAGCRRNAGDRPRNTPFSLSLRERVGVRAARRAEAGSVTGRAKALTLPSPEGEGSSGFGLAFVFVSFDLNRT